jgi:hypothetical protein
MEIDNLSGMPDWRDDDFENEEKEGEEWKPTPTRDTAKAMYEQWKQVMILLRGALENNDEEEGEKESKENKEKEDVEDFMRSFHEEQKRMIMSDAFEVAVKIQSSESGLYMIRMENAAIIRKNAQYIRTSMLGLMIENSIDETHGNVIREEIDKFRLLFRYWVSTFEKDEFEDEWVLYK